MFQAQKLKNVWPYFVPLGLSAAPAPLIDGETQKKLVPFLKKIPASGGRYVVMGYKT